MQKLDMYMAEDDLKAKVHRIFKEKTQQELTDEVTCYVEEYAHGGMSSGNLSGDWIVNRCVPLLQERLRKMQAGVSQ